MKDLRLMVLMLVGTLMPFAINFALAKSEGNALKETPGAANSAGRASSTQRQKAAIEDVVKGIANTTFARLDTNKDGKVSHEEFMAPYEKEFKQTDANNDGFWTKEEYIDFRIKQMERIRQEHTK